MPFLVPLLPAIAGGVAAAAAGSALNGSKNDPKAAGFQAQVAGGPGASGAAGQQQAFINALAQQNGIANQSSVLNQLQGIANGTGPNPAQAQLAQATSANVANQAALMAGQRGAGTNAGLIARQAGLQGGALQQQAVGQAASLQAQQSLNALNAAGNIATTQVGQLNQGIGQLGNIQIGQQSNTIRDVQGANNLNANLALYNAGQDAKLTGGIASGLGSAVSGLVSGAGSQPSAPSAPAGSNQGDYTSLPDVAPVGSNQGDYTALAHGGKVPSGEPRSMYGRHLAGLNLKAGGKVPGQAKVQGDSLKNDVVPAMLSPGEIVIPRSVLQSKNPAAAAAKFVTDTLKKQGKK